MAEESPTHAEMLAYERRWQLVRERTRREERSATLEQKFDELERLMQSLDDFGWRAKLDDDGPVRARWRRLRERLKER